MQLASNFKKKIGFYWSSSQCARSEVSHEILALVVEYFLPQYIRRIFGCSNENVSNVSRPKMWQRECLNSWLLKCRDVTCWSLLSIPFWRRSLYFSEFSQMSKRSSRCCIHNRWWTQSCRSKDTICESRLDLDLRLNWQPDCFRSFPCDSFDDKCKH